MTTTTMRDLRANLKSHFDSLESNKEVLIVPRPGEKEAVVIMTLSEYNSILETDYLLSSPANRNMLEESIAQLQKGETITVTIDE